MHKNLLWRGFLFIIFISTISYSCVAAYKYYNYTRLSKQILPIEIMWESQELATDSFIPAATYTFSFSKQLFSGTDTWPNDSYRNQWAIDEGLKEYRAKEWKVWFDPHHPTYSSLQKNLPIKECISAIILWGLFFYFLWLSFYVTRFNSK